MRKDIQDKPAQWHLGMNTLGFNAMVGPVVNTIPRRSNGYSLPLRIAAIARDYA